MLAPLPVRTCANCLEMSYQETPSQTNSPSASDVLNAVFSAALDQKMNDYETFHQTFHPASTGSLSLQEMAGGVRLQAFSAGNMTTP